MPKASQGNGLTAGANAGVAADAGASDARRRLVDRLVQSRYIAKSTRLNDLLRYLCERVLAEGATEIHEQEVGHAVFGRGSEYDTALDNIVRVHASTLRKRLEQYFTEEGRDEPIVIELPKGNYAPVFREREFPESAAESARIATVSPPLSLTQPLIEPPPARLQAPQSRSGFWILAALAVLFAGATFWLLLLRAQPSPSMPAAVRAFWSSIFVTGQSTDVVLDDAALALYQELFGKPVALSEYFDRSYLRRLSENPNAAAIVLKRQSSYASAGLLWQISQAASALHSEWAEHFARDYAYRQLKTNRAILLGNRRSNPWIEPFENRLSIRWEYDAAASTYFPVAGGHEYRDQGDHADGFASVALVSNLGGTGNVLILTATGGAASSASMAFLTDEDRMSEVRRRIGGEFRPFEALIRIPGRSRVAKDAEILLCRPVTR